MNLNNAQMLVCLNALVWIICGIIAAKTNDKDTIGYAAAFSFISGLGYLVATKS